jgi:hypothetical protein
LFRQLNFDDVAIEGTQSFDGAGSATNRSTL